MTPLLLSVLVLVIGAIAVAATRAHRTKVNESWAAAARKLGLTFRPAGFFRTPRLEGRVENCDVVVDVYRKSAGQHSESRTRYKVRYPEPLHLGLRLTRERVLAGLAKLFGAQDIEVGEASFDKTVLVKGRDPNAVASYLTPARRLRVLRLLETLDAAVIDDTGITWSRRHTETDSSRLVDVVRRLARNARALHGRPAGEDHLDAALAARREGRMSEALERARRAAAGSEETSPEAPLVEGDILATGGRFGEAEQAYARATSLEPADREATALAAHARQRSGEATSDAAPAAGSGIPSASPAPSPHDVAAIAADLFERGRLSLEITRRFDERYRGTAVHWEGVLRQVQSFSFDLVFGDGPGTKAIVEVFQADTGLFGRTVQAVLRLPEDARESLRDRSGDRVAFEGRLVGCDAFMRNLFVADARVL